MGQRTTRPALAVALAAAVVALAGCTTTVAGNAAADPAPAPTEGPGSDPVLWVDRVCGSLLVYTGPVLAQPKFDDAPELGGIKQKLDTYLDGVVAGLQQSRDQLGGVGHSPVGGGDEAVGRVDDLLEKLQADIGAAKAKVDAADPNDPKGFLDAITDAEKQLGAIAAPDALAELNSVPRLRKPVANAANCQQLSAKSAPPPN